MSKQYSVVERSNRRMASDEYKIIREKWLNLIKGDKEPDFSNLYFTLTEQLRLDDYGYNPFSIVLFTINLINCGDGKIQLPDDECYVEYNSHMYDMLETAMFDATSEQRDAAVKYVEGKLGEKDAEELHEILDRVW